MLPSIQAAERDLRHAIERGASEEISRSIAGFCEAADGELGRLVPGDPARRRMLEQVLSTLEWARQMLQTRRAQQAGELSLLGAANRFQGREPVRDPHFQLDL